MPLGEMYMRGIHLHTSRVSSRAVLPEVLELVSSGRLDPAAVTSTVARFEDAADALADPPTKLVLTVTPALAPRAMQRLLVFLLALPAGLWPAAAREQQGPLHRRLPAAERPAGQGQRPAGGHAEHAQQPGQAGRRADAAVGRADAA